MYTDSLCHFAQWKVLTLEHFIAQKKAEILPESRSSDKVHDRDLATKLAISRQYAIALSKKNKKMKMERQEKKSCRLDSTPDTNRL